MTAIKREEVIGDCRLILGDCLEVMPELGKVDAVVTDLPYGMTACDWDDIIPAGPMWNNINSLIKENSAVVMTASQPFTTMLISSNIDMFKYCWVWVKNRATNFPNAKRRPLTGHEDIVVFMNGPLWYNPQKTTGHKPTNSAKGASQGTIYHGDNIRNYDGGDTERYPVTVQSFDCERGWHENQKPVSLMSYIIRTYSNEGDTVLDFTMGSGTTGVSCVETGRGFIGIEKKLINFDKACKRIDQAQRQGKLFAPPKQQPKPQGLF